MAAAVNTSVSVNAGGEGSGGRGAGGGARPGAGRGGEESGITVEEWRRWVDFMQNVTVCMGCVLLGVLAIVLRMHGTLGALQETVDKLSADTEVLGEQSRRHGALRQQVEAVQYSVWGDEWKSLHDDVAAVDSGGDGGGGGK